VTEPPAPDERSSGPSGVVYAPLPVPGNAEILIYLAVVVVLAIAWGATAAVDARDFVFALTALTIGYLLSRGIAKAGRVGERP
jgi:hypothetical protein